MQSIPSNTLFARVQSQINKKGNLGSYLNGSVTINDQVNQKGKGKQSSPETPLGPAVEPNSATQTMCSTQQNSFFHNAGGPLADTQSRAGLITGGGTVKLKPPLSTGNFSKQGFRTQTPLAIAPSRRESVDGSNNFRVQTAKGIRSNAFINFGTQSQSSTQMMTHVGTQSRLATASKKMI